MIEQFDIDGDTHALEAPPQPVVAPQPAEQPRLFEPQMEGQLTFGDDDGDA